MASPDVQYIKDQVARIEAEIKNAEDLIELGHDMGLDMSGKRADLRARQRELEKMQQAIKNFDIKNS